jgi:DNA-binding transcriptional regulator YhcF (GntR family)
VSDLCVSVSPCSIPSFSSHGRFGYNSLANISMIKIDTRSATPISEQIKKGLQELASKGLLKEGDSLPSAKKLSETLLIHPNITARAYHELLKEGFLIVDEAQNLVISGKGSPQIAMDRADLTQQYALALQHMRDAGVSWEELESTLEMIKRQETSGHSGKRISEKSTCPYCRERIAEEAETVSCMICKTIHHRECWDDAGHCSVFGCRGKVRLLL